MDFKKFEKNLKEETNQAMANGMLKKLKANHPEFSWSGILSIDAGNKTVSGKGFTKEEMEIINNITLQ